MNILILSWRDPKHPLAGGAEQSVFEHAKCWLKAGNKVIWFSSRFSGSSRDEKIEGIQIVRSGYQYLGVQIAAFFYYLKNKKSIDLVVDQFHGIPFFAPLYVRKPKLAIVQETARKVWFLNPLPIPLNLIIGLIGYLTEPIVFLFYKRVKFMTGSESARRDVSRFGVPLMNIRVIPHGVILPKERVTSSKEKVKTVTFLGILSRDKGIEDALKCFSILDKEGDYQFWVIGKAESESYLDKLSRMVKELKLTGKIKFWGYVSNSTKFSLLKRSHILVNPSVHEGWGLVNIEANAMGTPVVSYNSAGLIDSVKDGKSGLIVGQNKPHKLAEAISSILADQENYKSLVMSSIAWSNNFSWKKSSQKSLDLIKDVLNANE